MIMTCLINGMVPESKIGNIPIGDIDSNDGYEFGTWDFPDYIRLFEKALNKKPNEGINQDEQEKKGGFWINHKFTEEERAKIHTFLVERRKIETEPRYNKKTGERKEDLIFIRMPTKTSMFKDPWELKPKWYDRLVELFSKPDDLPVWVSA